jgi:hypothetical protein
MRPREIEIARRTRVERLQKETAAYYDALTPLEKAEDAAISDASATAATELDIDGAPATRRKPRTSKRRRR